MGLAFHPGMLAWAGSTFEFVVHKDANRGCCEGSAGLMCKSGFQVGAPY